MKSNDLTSFEVNLISNCRVTNSFGRHNTRTGSSYFWTSVTTATLCMLIFNISEYVEPNSNRRYSYLVNLDMAQLTGGVKLYSIYDTYYSALTTQKCFHDPFWFLKKI